MPGMGELVIILLIVLVVFGANKLPGIGDALGRSIKNFKRASKVDDDDKDDAEADSQEAGQAARGEQAAEAARAGGRGRGRRVGRGGGPPAEEVGVVGRVLRRAVTASTMRVALRPAPAAP